MKDDYIEKIIELLHKDRDVSVLDYIYRLLIKSC